MAPGTLDNTNTHDTVKTFSQPFQTHTPLMLPRFSDSFSLSSSPHHHAVTDSFHFFPMSYMYHMDFSVPVLDACTLYLSRYYLAYIRQSDSRAGQVSAPFLVIFQLRSSGQ
jgi:hypothetical protein